MRTLVLGLGNDLIADDGVGLLAARRLAETHGHLADVVESGLAGLALLDLFLDYDRALVIDAIQTGTHPPGTILAIRGEELDAVVAPSPHYAGLPEMFALAQGMGLAFPRDVRILAMEVEDAATIGAGLTPTVAAALPVLLAQAGALLEAWPAE
jgi:hydrogenase maturation protease